MVGCRSCCGACPETKKIGSRQVSLDVVDVAISLRRKTECFSEKTGEMTSVTVTDFPRNVANVVVGILQKQQCGVHAQGFEIIVGSCSVHLAKGHLKT